MLARYRREEVLLRMFRSEQLSQPVLQAAQQRDLVSHTSSQLCCAETCVKSMRPSAKKRTVHKLREEDRVAGKPNRAQTHRSDRAQMHKSCGGKVERSL